MGTSCSQTKHLYRLPEQWIYPSLHKLVLIKCLIIISIQNDNQTCSVSTKNTWIRQLMRLCDWTNIFFMSDWEKLHSGEQLSSQLDDDTACERPTRRCQAATTASLIGWTRSDLNWFLFLMLQLIEDIFNNLALTLCYCAPFCNV